MSNRLLPFLKSAAAMNKSTLDLQETFRRLTYDLVCQIGFSYDLQYLLPSLPPTPFADAYETALKISMGRYTTLPFIWKVKKKFNTKSQKRLKHVVDEIQEFMGKRIKEKKEKLVNNRKWIDDHDDLFDRIMKRGQDKLQLGEAYYVDAAINFILAGQDTLCSALTWFFWLVSTNPSVEIEIVKEIKEKDDWREMVYTHASICESMRLYPPVPVEGKQAAEDDVWPDGTKVKKGMRVCFHILAMGRSEELWGSNWADFRPERWLDKSVETGEWRFIARDPFTYPVFLAGPRTCLGKQVAFIQMKMVASTILKHFRVIPSMEDFVPSYHSSVTSKMKNGFPVKILERF
ncbi:cytochrome p450 94b3 [Nicotiana attenuata]|uniref:Cytochrome p450 94b3 n=2 Tax=Nicotiana attenuata TaxID=49451 RepID=A0A314L4D5_NICAT|nr:cytochrome p450 94b3 [Nicotiana attenuata]